MLTLIIYGFLTFLAGFIIDTAYIYSIHFSERHQPLYTAICAMIMGVCQIFGIGKSINNKYMALLYILGFGVGTYTAVKIKSKKLLLK